MKRAWLMVGILCMAGWSGRAADDVQAAWKKAVGFLATAQGEDGAWGYSRGKVGITAVNLEALALAPENIQAEAKDMMRKAAAYLAAQQREDGAIHDEYAPKNYSTSHAVQALIQYDHERYAPQIAKAVKWIKTVQADEARKFDPEKHVGYGGFGYGSTTRPDLNNTWIALNALKLAGVSDDDPVWNKALTFLKRCQNSTEVNDVEADYIGDDGGAKYLPTDHSAGSPAGTETTRDGRTIRKSYGSASCGLLAAYRWIGLEKDALPVKKVVGFLEENFTLKKNINTKDDGQQGRFGYYRALAKALSAYGEKTFAGKKWSQALTEELLSLQQEDGSWVNPVDRWQEGDPALATGYALTALALAQRPMK